MFTILSTPYDPFHYIFFERCFEKVVFFHARPVFPADGVGGPDYIKAVKAPLPQIDLIPTGGVDINTAPQFIKAGATAVGAGSSLIDKKLVKEGNYSALAQRTKDFLKAIRDARV